MGLGRDLWMPGPRSGNEPRKGKNSRQQVECGATALDVAKVGFVKGVAEGSVCCHWFGETK